MGLFDWLSGKPSLDKFTESIHPHGLCNLAGLEVPPTKEHSLTFRVPSSAGGREPYLFFKAAAQSSKAAGYCNRAIRVLVNAAPVDTERLCNRATTATMMNGHVLTVAQGDGCFLIPWAPDFAATDRDPIYSLTDGVKACEYELYLGGLLTEGDNTVTFFNMNSAGLDYTVLLGNVEFHTRSEPPASKDLAPAPSGELPVIVPKTSFSKTYSELRWSDAEVSFTIDGRTFKVQSKFSTPDGRWMTGENRFFRRRREVIEHDEWVLVRDTLVNQTAEALPLMQHHRSPVGNEATGVWLAGAKMPTKSGKHVDGVNPSAFAATGDSGIGLVALNDEFRVHANMIADNGSITLSDPHFVLSPGASYTAEMAIVPVAKPDFYAFVNAARRMLDVNFKLDVSFAFMFHKPPVYEWSDTAFTQFIDNKSANFVVKSN